MEEMLFSIEDLENAFTALIAHVESVGDTGDGREKRFLLPDIELDIKNILTGKATWVQGN